MHADGFGLGSIWPYFSIQVMETRGRKIVSELVSLPGQLQMRATMHCSIPILLATNLLGIAQLLYDIFYSIFELMYSVQLW